MLIGHEALRNDFIKLAQNDALAQSYIFFGPPGVGKKQFALHLAGYLESGSFEAISVPTETLLIGFGPEGNIGIDAIREMRSFLWQTPNRGSRRIAIIDDSHRMTAEAQNALLKIAEEPPKSALLILITDDPEKMLPTISSRFQKTYFPAVPKQDVLSWLKKEIGISAKDAEKIADRTFGSPGLAWRMAKDESFQDLVLKAEKLTKAPPTARKTMIKEMIDEEFDFDNFLLALTISIVPVEPGQYAFWHQIQELRRDASEYNLNPRLQLAALYDVLR